MELNPDLFFLVYYKLIWPLIRLLCFISLGLLFANFIESLNWTSKVAAVAKPLIRLGHLSQTAGASFSMALFSGVAANTMLAEVHDKDQMSKKELILANLFNSLPTYFLHLPTMFFITAPLIKGAAVIYVSITFGAAILRTTSIIFLSRFLLKKPEDGDQNSFKIDKSSGVDWPKILNKTWKRFKKRIKKILKYTIPIYIIVFILNQYGIFQVLEKKMADFLLFLPWLSPQSMGIITLHVAAEFTAGLAAAGALLQEGTMNYRQIVLALIVGNILSSPLRAIRHQFPYYAGIFKPKIAMELILYNQLFRIISLILVSTVYFIITM